MPNAELTGKFSVITGDFWLGSAEVLPFPAKIEKIYLTGFTGLTRSFASRVAGAKYCIGFAY
jgi:hypothetical protein